MINKKMSSLYTPLLTDFYQLPMACGYWQLNMHEDEAVFNLLESVVPEYDRGGEIRECSGSTLTGIVPTNTYRCKGGKFVIIGANGDSIFKRLTVVMGKPEMGEDPRFADNAGRVEHEPEIDAAIAEWMSSLTKDEALKLLEEAEVPSGPIYSVADMFADEHFKARGLFETVESNGSPLIIPAMIPKLSDTPGKTRWPGLHWALTTTKYWAKCSVCRPRKLHS